MQAIIVDDSRAMRRILRQIITPMGFEIDEAGDGVEGWEKLQEHSDVELMLVDWNMPRMDGLELVKKIRENDEYRNVKLVMVTTETEPGRMARAIMAGVDEFLMKPFTSDMLIEKLQLLGVSIPGI